ncbi:hypothetical protein COLO4_30673 [Corchorus olitorius]|uniref:Uncharacterized protein n=1 Tax=Corchorus olitorius TaxID=93759 RepID=A0A1R3H7C2_9ROSI|nr:hypothetical protein COLO4_30673 [Corchorus olitorius]
MSSTKALVSASDESTIFIPDSSSLEGKLTPASQGASFLGKCHQAAKLFPKRRSKTHLCCFENA